MNYRDFTGDRFQVIVPSLLMNTAAKRDLDILMVLLVVLGALRGPLG